MKKKASTITYWSLAIFVMASFCISLFLNKYLNYTLNNYYDFIGDVLNFSSIFTGFLGVILGILVSINADSILINKIMTSSIAKRDLYILIIVPFISGMLNICINIFYRLVLTNPTLHGFLQGINLFFLTSTIFFLLSGALMTLIIFQIFFKQNEETRKPDIVKTSVSK